MRKRTVKIPLPIRKDIGLGDVVKKAASLVGVKPCSACNKRAEKLNSRVGFTPWGGRLRGKGV